MASSLCIMKRGKKNFDAYYIDANVKLEGGVRCRSTFSRKGEEKKKSNARGRKGNSRISLLDRKKENVGEGSGGGLEQGGKGEGRGKPLILPSTVGGAGGGGILASSSRLTGGGRRYFSLPFQFRGKREGKCLNSNHRGTLRKGKK